MVVLHHPEKVPISTKVRSMAVISPPRCAGDTNPASHQLRYIATMVRNVPYGLYKGELTSEILVMKIKYTNDDYMQHTEACKDQHCKCSTEELAASSHQRREKIDMFRRSEHITMQKLPASVFTALFFKVNFIVGGDVSIQSTKQDDCHHACNSLLPNPCMRFPQTREKSDGNQRIEHRKPVHLIIRHLHIIRSAHIFLGLGVCQPRGTYPSVMPIECHFQTIPRHT